VKNLRTASGNSRPFYSDEDVERMCEDELRLHGYYPAQPGPVNIDRFIEKRFGVSIEFEEMPKGVLGFSRFGSKGMLSMHISSALAEEGSRAAERLVNSTLAHEAGHGLMHTHLFVLADYDATLFGSDPDVNAEKILCRDEAAPARRGYDGRWWELQAGMAIGPLLMPKRLVIAAVAPFCVTRGTFGVPEIDSRRREEAVRHLADTFEVNPAAARVRLEKLYKPSGSQLTL